MPSRRPNHLRAFARVAGCALVVCLTLVLAGCGGSETSGGSAFAATTNPVVCTFDEAAATGSQGALIDVSHAADGYVGVQVSSSKKIKVQVIGESATTNFDTLADGEPHFFPFTAGSGSYQVKVMQNTTENRYVELASATVDVQLSSEAAPYLVPNVYCEYDASSSCVAKAAEVCGSASTQTEALEAIAEWVCDNISYDKAKAASLADSTGYIPDPDETLAEGTGICFDYASLTAAMLRSQGIPCKIITGYVSGNVYHAWNEVFIDGSWTSVSFEVEKNTWSRIDTTFAAAGATSTTGDGNEYTDRFVY